MPNVSFDEEPQFARRSNVSSSYGPTRKKLLMRLGIARTEQESQYILLALTVICIVTALFIFLKQTHKPLPKAPPLPPGVVPHT